MTEFNFSSFDSRKYGYIRGRSILNQLLGKKDFEEWGVKSVQIVSGHIAINFQLDGKSICLFDATVATHQLTESISNNIQSLLLQKQLLQPPLSPATQSLPLLACSFNSTIVKFGFEKFIAPVSTTSVASTSSNSLLNSSSSQAGSSKNNKSSTVVIDNSPLRLFVFEADGYLHIWEWNIGEYKWKYIAKIYLPFVNRDVITTTPYSIEKDLQNTISSAAVFGSSQGMAVTWMNQFNAINCRVLNFNSIRPNDLQTKRTHTTIKDKFIDEMYPGNLVITGLEIYEIKKDWENFIKSPSTSIISSKHGIWFITSSFILLWSFRNKLWNITYLKNNSSNSKSNNIDTTNSSSTSKSTCDIHGSNEQIIDKVEVSAAVVNTGGENGLINDNCIIDILAFCKNPLYQDLIVLEESGKLFSCEPSSSEKEKLNVKLVAVIDLKIIGNKRGIGSDVKLLMHQNAFIVLYEKNAYFYDTKCGAFLCKTTLPTELTKSKQQSLWENGTAGIIWGCGYFSQSDGIWEVRSMIPPFKFIESISTHNSNTTNSDSVIGGCAASTCKQWDLKNLESKYLLEMALNETDETTKIQICKSLLPRLENPSLIIVVLSSLQSFSSCKFIMDELKLFLENYDYYQNLKQQQQQQNSSDDERISKIKKSFIYHTPLNQKMIPLLKEYFQLQKLATENQPQQEYSLLSNNSNLLPDLFSIADSMILDFSYEQIDQLKMKQPELLLQKLENALSLSNIDYSGFDDINGEVISLPMANPILLHTEESLKPQNSKDNHLTSSLATHGGGGNDEIKSNLSLSNGINNSNLSNGIGGNGTGNRLIITFVGDNGIIYPLKFPVFEILCQLYYNFKPKNLIPFICMVHNSAIARSLDHSTNGDNNQNNNQNNQNNINTNVAREKDHFFRALMALPISLPLKSSVLQDDQIDARFKLLISIGHKPNALRFLLNTNKWDRAIELVRNTTYNEAESYVLYEILLSFCIEKKDNSKLKQCWDTIPKNFSVFNLLALLKPSSSTNTTITSPTTTSPSGSATTSENSNTTTPPTPQTNVYNPSIIAIPNSNSDDLTIDMFRGQLLKMLNK